MVLEAQLAGLAAVKAGKTGKKNCGCKQCSYTGKRAGSRETFQAAWS